MFNLHLVPVPGISQWRVNALSSAKGGVAKVLKPVPANLRHVQCDISTGIVIESSTVRVTPPNRISRKREWP
ncbi:MAG: hypothetical protein V7642_986 [Burkholderiales bacterium]